VHVELDNQLAAVSEDAMTGAIEAVDVTLQSMTQRDTRDRQAAPRIVEQPRQ